MRILVQKFGGTSLSTAGAREHAIRHIMKALTEDYHVVIVVSAMGRKGDPYATDSLLDVIESCNEWVTAREKDLLMSCGEVISAVVLCGLLNEHSVPAIVLTGAQAGIHTNDHYGNARIESIQPIRIFEQLEQGKVVIVTGFQGKTRKGDITTLGRGGSDTSAVALGVALQADIVDIFTDVDGILTADPRIVDDARSLNQVTYTEICNMANNGAKVIHPRAVEVAMQANLPIRVRSTFSDSEGTLVGGANFLHANSGAIRDRYVTGIAHRANITQIQVFAAEGQYDLQLNIFKSMAMHEISVDFINVNPTGVMYTISDHEVENAVRVLRSLGYEPEVMSQCAKVSVIGGGMNGVPGVMASIVEALTEADIQILQSADSNTTIWVLVKVQELFRAVRALHCKFQLNK